MIARLWRSTFGLSAMVALGFVLATLVIGTAASWLAHEAIEEQLDRRVEVETEALLGRTDDGDISALAAEIRRRDSARSSASLVYLVLDDAGQVLASTMQPDSPVKPGYTEHLHYRRQGRQSEARAMATPIPGGLLVVAADREELDAIDRQFILLFVSALIALTLVGMGSAALIGVTTQRRLARIENTALGILAGDFSRRVPRDGSGSEFDRLADVLNRMLDRIGGLIENLREVSSDVAHDLRTPLTRLYHQLDRAIEELDAAQKTHRIEAARDEAAELLNLFSAILRIAEIEGMAERLPRESVDVSGLIEQMAETYRPDMEDSDHALHCEIEPGLTLSGDRRLLSQVLANLLDNSLRHTPAGTKVSLTAQRVQGAVQIAVSDNGPGVEAAEARRLFHRFARSERSRSTPGNGLGLALVASVAAAHGGSARIEGEGGFSVVLAFPTLS
ncbi:MAG: ATP-binding protein [Lysobacteraceae bacterium]